MQAADAHRLPHAGRGRQEPAGRRGPGQGPGQPGPPAGRVKRAAPPARVSAPPARSSRPLPRLRSVGPLGEGRPRGVLLPLPFCTSPLPHPTPRLCYPGRSWTEGTQGRRIPGGDREAQGERGCCPPATPAWPKGATRQILAAAMALRRDRASRLGNQAGPSPSSAHGGPLP